MIVDHTGPLPHIRDRWNRLARMPHIDVALFCPERWRENFVLHTTVADPDEEFVSFSARTWCTGREMRSFYRGELAAALSAFRPDVVLMMEESFTLFGLQIFRASRRFDRQVPIIFYNNNVAGYDFRGFRLGAIYRAIGQYVTPRCQLGLCVNERAAQVLEQSGHDVEREVLFYGVDERRFRPEDDRDEARAIRTELGLGVDDTLILYAGRLLELKGIDDLIEAMKVLVSRFDEKRVHLLILGTGPYEDSLRRSAADLSERGDVTFRSTVSFDEVPAFMRAADAHVLPSRPEINEQFGRVNVEAMLCGTLAIAARSGGVPDVIGDGGYLYESGRIDELVGILGRVVERDPSIERIRAAGYRRALERFSTTAFVERIAEIVTDIGRKRRDKAPGREEG